MEWYVKHIKDKPAALVECMQQMFCKRFLTTKTIYGIIIKLSTICQMNHESIDKYYTQFCKMYDALNLWPEDDVMLV